MAVYIDRSRKSEVTCSIASNLRVFVFPNDVPIPDDLERYGPVQGATTFGSNQQTGSVTILGIGGSSAFGTASWTWQVVARVTTNNGFGVSSTSDLVLQSGTGTPAQASVGISVNVGGLNIDWTGTVDQSTVYWDITQAAFSGVGAEYPDITYNSYETSNIGGTATAKIVINGLTKTSTGTISTASAMTWDLRLGLNMFNNTTVAQTLTVSPGLCNGTSLVSSVPSYSHTYFGQTATALQYVVTGYGPSVGYIALITGTTNITLRRLMRMKGQIRAFDKSYPDDLACRITGFDVGGLGYRDITATAGAFQEDAAFLNTFVQTNITSWSGTATVNQTNSQTVNTVPTSISADIKTASLTALGDDTTNTKLMLRGWWFPGASVIQADTTPISTGVVTSTRTFSAPGIALNSYRYLRIQLRSLTGTTQNGTLTLTTQPGSVLKTYSISATSSTTSYFYLDLNSPQNATTTIDETDNPYPRMNPSDTTNVAQYVDGDYYGVNRVTSIAITNANLELGDVHVVIQDPSSNYTKGYWCPTKNWYKQKFTTFGGVTQYTNRLYQGDAQGNTQTEEGWALWSTTPTSTIMTITDFVNEMNATDSGVKRHQGYSCSASTPNTSPTFVKNGYANSVNGHAYWLGGTTFRKIGGSGEVKHWVDTDQSLDGPEAQVYAQTYFRSINGNYVPDMLDVFEQGDSGDLWMTVGAVSYQRGRSHGLVLQTNSQPLAGSTVQLTLDSDGSLRGTGTSDTAGRYDTSYPYGLGTKNHNTLCLLLNTFDPDPLSTNKQYRACFRQAPAAGTMLSADRDDIYRHYYATISGGAISLWKANGPLATDYVEQVTSITGVSDGCLRMLTRDNLNGGILFVQKTSGNLERYYTSDSGATISVATVINSTGTRPAFCVDTLGREIYIWRTSAGNIESKILDSAGTVLMTATVVVTGSVADTSIDIYERLDDLYIVYNHTSTGITVVRSTDGGRTYS
jgi:hypothetical protein